HATTASLGCEARQVNRRRIEVSVDRTERHAPRRRVALIVLGSIVGLIGVALLAGGGTVLWADQTQRDSSGLFTQAGHRVTTDSYAVTQDGVSVHHLPGFANNGKLLRVRIDARSEIGRAHV